ncbi:MAG TPA: hypothetical protein VHC22_28965 [Pirellulales bacterium]|nr:hypothetical protein [Pirellulales bacterium]
MRYRLKTLFILTFLVAVACAVLFSLPAVLSLAVLGAVAMVTPAGLIAGIIYGRGAKRAFAIGCLASGGWALWASPFFVAAALSDGIDVSDQPIVVQIAFVAYYAVVALGGGVSVGVRRLCYQGRNGIRPPRDCC